MKKTGLNLFKRGIKYLKIENYAGGGIGPGPIGVGPADPIGGGGGTGTGGGTGGGGGYTGGGQINGVLFSKVKEFASSPEDYYVQYRINVSCGAPEGSFFFHNRTVWEMPNYTGTNESELIDALGDHTGISEPNGVVAYDSLNLHVGGDPARGGLNPDTGNALNDWLDDTTNSNVGGGTWQIGGINKTIWIHISKTEGMRWLTGYAGASSPLEFGVSDGQIKRSNNVRILFNQAYVDSLFGEDNDPTGPSDPGTANTLDLDRDAFLDDSSVYYSSFDMHPDSEQAWKYSEPELSIHIHASSNTFTENGMAFINTENENQEYHIDFQAYKLNTNSIDVKENYDTDFTELIPIEAEGEES